MLYIVKLLAQALPHVSKKPVQLCALLLVPCFLISGI